MSILKKIFVSAKNKGGIIVNTIGTPAFSIQILSTTVFPLGNSYTVGERNLTGGWRTQMITPITWKGPYNSGGKHAGTSGDELDSDMSDRFATDWVGNESQEIWIEGGTNDIIGGGASTGDLAATELASLLDAIYAIVPNSQVIRIFSIPPADTGSDATIENYWRFKIAREVALDRAGGRKVYFHHTGGRLTTLDLDAIEVKHPIDGEYDSSGYGLWAAWNDKYLNLSNALDANETIVPAVIDFDARIGYNADTGIWSNQGTRSTSASPTGVNKPTIVAGQLGLALRFSNSPLRTDTGWGYEQPNTVAIVCSAINNTGSPAIIDGADTSNRHLIQCAATVGTLTMFAGASQSDGDINMSLIGHLYMCEFNSTSSKIDLDGNPRNQSLNPSTQQLGGLTIGGSAASTPTNTLSGDIHRIVVWDYALSTLEKFKFAKQCALDWSIYPILGETTSW